MNADAPRESIPATPPGAAWPERVIELARAWQAQREPARRERLLGELWTLLNAAVMRYLRVHGRRYGSPSAEDLEDIAADKALDLIRRIDGHRWDVAGARPAQVCAFVSTLARNGLIDHYRVVGRKRMEDLEAADRADPVPTAAVRPRVESPEARVERERFVEALERCAALLSPRARTAWFLRVLLDLPSRRIGAHPEVGMKPAAVDMALSRARAVIRACMAERGYDVTNAPEGTFPLIWNALRHALPADIEPSEDDA